MDNNKLKDLINQDKLFKDYSNIAYLVYTDCIKMIHVTESLAYSDASKLLECRIFNPQYELRMKRTSLGSEWKRREKDDLKNPTEDTIDTWYFLDIYATSIEPDGTFFTTTGKMKYSMPITLHTKEIIIGDKKKSKIVDNRLKIRSYIAYYPNTGQAYIEDWRLVEFEEKENG